MSRLIRIASFILAIVHAHDACAENHTLSSPDGRVEIRFSVADAKPTYQVLFQSRTVIARSSLGLELEEGPIEHVRELSESRTSADRTYNLVAGKTGRARDAYNEATFALEETDQAHRKLDIVVRAYNDGVAFRYVLPVQPQMQEVAIRGELTRFNFPSDYQCWAFNVGKFGNNHEGEFDPVQASRLREHNLLDLPLVCRGAGAAFAIAEADLADYSALYLTGRHEGGLGVAAMLSPRLDKPTVAVQSQLSHPGRRHGR